MSKPSPAVEAAGLRAYEQVQAFESVRGRGLPYIYGALVLLLLLASAFLIEADRLALGCATLVIAIVFFGIVLFQWRRLQARHATNLMFLAELEGRYGPELPWLQVEAHLAALKIVQAEVEKDKAEGKSAPEK